MEQVIKNRTAVKVKRSLTARTSGGRYRGVTARYGPAESLEAGATYLLLLQRDEDSGIIWAAPSCGALALRDGTLVALGDSCTAIGPLEQAAQRIAAAH